MMLEVVIVVLVMLLHGREQLRIEISVAEIVTGDVSVWTAEPLTSVAIAIDTCTKDTTTIDKTVVMFIVLIVFVPRNRVLVAVNNKIEVIGLNAQTHGDWANRFMIFFVVLVSDEMLLDGAKCSARTFA